MIMMTNLAIRTIVVPHLTKFLTKLSRVICKRRISTKRKETKGEDKNTIIKEKEENSKCEIQTIKERKGNLDIPKNRYP